MTSGINNIIKKATSFASAVVSKVTGGCKSQKVAHQAISKATAPNITTEMHKACANDDLDQVSRLLRTQKGQDSLTALDAKGMTPMHHACVVGHWKVVELLLRSANCDCKAQLTRDGYSPLLLATEKMLSEGEIEASNFDQIITLLLDAGADIESGDSLGRTPFMRACESKHKFLAKVFLERGANINAVNRFGHSTLICMVNDTSWVKFLLENGADVNIQGSDGSTALSWACEEDCTESARMLLDKRADPEKGVCLKGIQEFSSLHLACYNQNAELVRELVRAGADVNRACRGKQPIDVCYDDRDPEIFEFLIARGAKPSIETRANIIALHPEYESKFNTLEDVQWVAAKRLALANHIENHKDSEIPFEGWYNSIFYRDIANQIEGGDLDDLVDKNALVKAFHKASKLPIDIEGDAKAIKKEKLVVLQSGWKGHHLALVFYKGYIAICNRGDGYRGRTVELYKIDLSQFTPDLLKRIVEAKQSNSDVGKKFFYQTLLTELAYSQDAFCKAVEKLSLSSKQEVGNCPFAGAAGAATAAMLLLATVDRRHDEEMLLEARAAARELILDLRLGYLNAYLAAHPNGEYEHLVAESWKKIKKRLRYYPVSLDAYPEVRKRLVEVENGWFYTRAIARVKKGAHRLRERVKARTILFSPAF